MFLLPYALVLLLYGGATILIRRQRTSSKPRHWIGRNDENAQIFEATAPRTKNGHTFSTSLAQARDLQAPDVTSTRGGELEHLEFWNSHSQLIQTAWHEWERDFALQDIKQTRDTDEHAALLFGRLPSLNEATMMEPMLKETIQQLWKKPTPEAEVDLKAKFWQEPIRNVYTCSSFFSPQGIRNLRTHLKLMGQSGIPTRRPNGMNRNGFVLDDETEGGVSYKAVDNFRSWLLDDYLRPLGRMFFPEYIGSDEDDVSSYAFTIHYQYANDEEELTTIGTSEGTSTSAAGATNLTSTRKKRDVQLKEHSDASAVTININLNLPEEGDDYDGSQLLFLEDDESSSSASTTGSSPQEKEQPIRHSLEFQPGMAVIHRGLHRHQALPIQKGQRHQLIIWLFGTDGYVRVAPYEPKEQLSVQQRWSKSKSNRNPTSQTQGEWDPLEL